MEGWGGETGEKEEKAKLSLLSAGEEPEALPLRRRDLRLWVGEEGELSGALTETEDAGSTTRTIVRVEEEDRLGSWFSTAFFPSGSGALTDPRLTASLRGGL